MKKSGSAQVATTTPDDEEKEKTRTRSNPTIGIASTPHLSEMLKQAVKKYPITNMHRVSSAALRLGLEKLLKANVQEFIAEVGRGGNK